MARPIKSSIDYYNMPVDFLKDRRIRKIKRACGPYAIEVLICLVSSIYGNRGYYTDWDEDALFDVVDDVGAQNGAVTEILRKALSVGYFDEEMFQTYKIITSKEIQEFYMFATAKRKSVEMDKRYLLTKIVNSNINLINSDINPVNEVDNSQSKVKETKVNKTKKKNKKTTSTYAADSPYLQLAHYLYQRINADATNEADKTKQPNWQQWADDIRKLVEIDKKTIDKVHNMIDWAMESDFWQGVIGSASGLRKNYDSMATQANAMAKKKKPKQKETLPDWAKKRQNAETTAPQESPKVSNESVEAQLAALRGRNSEEG